MVLKGKIKQDEERLRIGWVAIFHSGSWEDLSEETYKKLEGRKRMHHSDVMEKKVPGGRKNMYKSPEEGGNVCVFEGQQGGWSRVTRGECCELKWY